MCKWEDKSGRTKRQILAMLPGKRPCTQMIHGVSMATMIRGFSQATTHGPTQHRHQAICTGCAQLAWQATRQARTGAAIATAIDTPMNGETECISKRLPGYNIHMPLAAILNTTIWVIGSAAQHKLFAFTSNFVSRGRKLRRTTRSLDLHTLTSRAL